jgi:hypothetical protein
MRFYDCVFCQIIKSNWSLINSILVKSKRIILQIFSKLIFCALSGHISILNVNLQLVKKDDNDIQFQRN